MEALELLVTIIIVCFLGWFFPKMAEEKRTYDREKEERKEERKKREERNRYIHFRNSLPSYDYDCDENGEEIFFYDLDSIDDK